MMGKLSSLFQSLLHAHPSLVPVVPDASAFLPLIMPVVVSRLGTQEITEPSEELRLTLVSFLSSLVDLCGAKMAPYLSDMVCVLQRTLTDPYPEVKKVRVVKCYRCLATKVFQPKAALSGGGRVKK